MGEGQTNQQPPLTRRKSWPSELYYPPSRVSNRPWRSPFDNLFDAFFGEDSRLPVLTGNAAFSPRIDVREDDASYEISAELPGLAEKDIEVSVDDGTLVLRGEKSDG